MYIKCTTVAICGLAWDGLAGSCRKHRKGFGMCGLRHLHDSVGMRVLAISLFENW